MKKYPRNHSFEGHTPDGDNGMDWKNKYGFVAAVPFDMDSVVEGLNEEGLQVGVFFFQPYKKAKYQSYDVSKANNTIGGWQASTYILSQASTIAEVKQLLKNVNVVDSMPVPKRQYWDFSPQVHIAVNDANGDSVVVEYIDGELKIYDNPLGSVANQPDFEWHQENLKRYTNLPIDRAAPFGKDVKLSVSQGLDVGGLESLPGEITSANRFVRASVYSQEAAPFQTSDVGVQQVFNILNNFDIPKGHKLYRHTDGKDYAQYTQWTTVSDLKNKKMYIRSFYSPSVKLVDLNTINFDNNKVDEFEIPKKFESQLIKLN